MILIISIVNLKFCVYKQVIANAKTDEKPGAHFSTFGCPTIRAIASQPKELKYSPLLLITFLRTLFVLMN